MNEVVYDSGALIAIESQGGGGGFARHRSLLGRGYRVVVPSPVAAQVVREPHRQAQLMFVLRGCDIVPFGADDYSPVGKLLARSGTSDVVDGFVALTAAQMRAAVITSDPDGIRHLLDTLGVQVPIRLP